MTMRILIFSKRIRRKRFGFVIIGVALILSSALGLYIDDSMKTAVGKKDHIGAENLLSVVGNLGEASRLTHFEMSHDHFQTNARKLRGTPGKISNTKTGHDETRIRVEGTEISFGTSDDYGEGLYTIEDLSHAESGNYKGPFGHESFHRTLQNRVENVVEGLWASDAINAPSTAESHQIGYSRTIVGLTVALGVMAVLLSILSWIFVYIYRMNSLVAIGQPPCKLCEKFHLSSLLSLFSVHFVSPFPNLLVLYLICFGSMLLSSELFFLFRYRFTESSVRDDTCVAQLWFRNIGSVCVHMAIFCKLWRAYKVAQFRKNQIILPKHVIVPFVVMLLAVISVTIVQTVTDPPEWQLRRGPDGMIVGMCLPGSVSELSMREMDLRIEITTVVLQFLCLSIMLVMAYVTRKIPEDISDARRVFWAVVFGIFLSLIMTGLFWVGVFVEEYFLSAISRSLRYFFDGIIFVAFLIVPKIYAVWCENRKKRNGTRTNSAAATSTSRGRGLVHVSGIDPTSQYREEPH